MRLILNGKKADLPEVRNAVTAQRDQGPIEVRVTWEGGDMARLVSEALNEGCTRLVVGGGDGSVNEMVSALMTYPREQRPPLAILPLGTANDFAAACALPLDPDEALALAREGRPRPVDVGSANERFFLNVASGGFGARVTATTPEALKNFLGGGAYTLNGLLQALSFEPYQGRLLTPEGSLENRILVGAVCNGRQAGGGQPLAPNALLDDGLLDFVGLSAFGPQDLPQVLSELESPAPDNEFVIWMRLPWAEYQAEDPMPMNLDGEPLEAVPIRFQCHPGALDLILPQACPCLGG
ncbi:lipid kinase YegS [Ferrimonas sediminicola]|uniref:Probable lipid kinase YegS-like n=1 Tax=Ferrimonas sediminicola TaxID=2569538 RepID=A0A4U1BJ84_9GAMM|nr:lipid kinase YegS [Ferrimonas sediminicola]TKB51433.1 lipid kinase YegS [Ferrimonas sediminicola]